MVIDSIDNASIYWGLSVRIATALRSLAQWDWSTRELGRHPIDAERIFALVETYDTKPPALGTWEAHRRYLDIHYMAEGTERIGYAPLASLTAAPYIPERDLVPLSGTGDFMTVPHRGFAILWPQDGHMPGLAVDTPATVRKVVVKIACD